MGDIDVGEGHHTINFKMFESFPLPSKKLFWYVLVIKLLIESCHQLVVWTSKGDGIGFEGMDGPSEFQINLSHGWYPGYLHESILGILKTSELLLNFEFIPIQRLLDFSLIRLKV